jgi:tRNA (uracil-5-)-methyltransferase TRM9
VGLDSGTGNGKYLGLPTDHPGKFWTIGLDRSQGLLNLARTAGGSDKIREVVRGDVLDNGWRRGAFVRILCSYRAHLMLMHVLLYYSKDFAISIATIHHLATVERRVAGVKVRSSEYHSHTSVTSSNPETTRVCLTETWAHSDLCLGHRTG